MQGSSIQIRVSDMVFVLKKRWKMVLSLTIIGLLFGLLLFAMTYIQNSRQSFAASGSFAISTKNTEGIYINGAHIANNNDFHLAEDMADAVRYVVSSDHVLREVINEQGLLGVTVEDLRAKLTITQYQATQIMEMRVTWSSAESALNIWQSIVDMASVSLPNTLQVGELAVINEPQVEQVGTSGASMLLPAILAILGLMCGVGIAAIELLIRPTLTNAKDVETMFGLEAIGIIPRDDAYFKRHQHSLLVNNEKEHSVILQNYSAAAYILCNRLGEKNGHHCFYVTSSVAGEGKSIVAANLAIQLSDMEHKTLLIDFDMRNPSLGTLFMDKVDYTRSFNALYRNEATEEDAITHLTGFLDLLPSVLEHNAMSMDTTIMELIEKMRERYEYIIIDSAPVGEASETLSLNRVASAVLFVVGYDSTPLPVIENSLEKLDKSGIRVLGCIVNEVGERRRKNAGKNIRETASFSNGSASKKVRRTEKTMPPEDKRKAKKQDDIPVDELPKAEPSMVETQAIKEESNPAKHEEQFSATKPQDVYQKKVQVRQRDVLAELMAEEKSEK